MQLITYLPVLVILVVLKESEESCSPLPPVSFPIDYDRYQFITCKNISLDKDFPSKILSLSRRVIKQLAVVDSNIPVIGQNVFDGMNLTNLRIEAGVQDIQDDAFANCTMSSVSLSNNRIREIRNGTFNLTSLVVLALNNNSITEIYGKSFAGAFNLRQLDLHNNEISYIATYAFKDLQSLDELNLSHNRFSYVVPDLFRTVKYLRKLSLNNNFFKAFRAEIFVANPLLELLNLQSNYLTSFDGRQLPVSLLQLNLENNTIVSLNISNLIHLDILVLNSNNLRTINDCLINLPGLSQLYLNHNKLGSSLNKNTFADFKNLSLLEIDDNRISNLQFRILLNIKSLTALSLAENTLTFLDFTNIATQIKHLNFSSNAIQDINNLSSCSSLQTLELSNNNLSAIRFDIFSGLHNLKNLRLQNNSITEIQKGAFRDLDFASTLDLSYNKITSIPNSVLNGLKALVELDLSHNMITNIDEDIFHFSKSLRFLNIAYNNLSKLNVKNILQHTLWLRQINLDGNHWRCKDLIGIVRDHKGLILTGGTVFNVSNVNGIACNDLEDSTDNFNQIQYYRDVLKVLNTTLDSSQEMSRKFTFLNIVLVLCAVLIIGKFIYEQFAEKIKVSGQFVYKKSSSEQELQL